jgi:sialate O-acetylesterase
MIQSWRDSWKQPDLPFYFVQLAPYTAPKEEPTENNWAELREAQLLTTTKLKNTGMAVITDTVPVKEANDIHPKDKEPAGVRLALCARALTYGEKVEYTGPLYDSVKFDGNQAILTFTHVGKGLEAKGEVLQGFTVAGEDKKFYNAKAEIKGDSRPRSATAGRRSPSSTCSTRTACPRRRSAPTTSRSPRGRRSNKVFYRLRRCRICTAASRNS